MADSDHTLESHSSQETFPFILDLVVQESFVAYPPELGCLAMSVIPPPQEPCIILQGEWLREMGFERGQPVRVYVEPNLLQLTQGIEPVDASELLAMNKAGVLSRAKSKQDKNASEADNSKELDNSKDLTESKEFPELKSDDEGDVLAGVEDE